jgi:N-acyl-D-aspartate/D-glutamate deacylase
MTFDRIFVGGRLIDGTGSPWRYADLGIVGDTIAAIAPPGALDVSPTGARVAITGKVLCPGFIDIQSHSLLPYLTDGRGIGKVTQGVTTEILGELWTPAPFGGRRAQPFAAPEIPPALQDEARPWRRFGDWLGAYERRGVGVNIGSFVGGATVREWACAWDAAPATPEQIETMRRVTTDAMDDGAFGIAPALIYPPDSFSTDDQLTACAQIVGRAGGLYIVHLRSEGDGLLDAIDATAALSRAADCPVEIYHLKASGARNWDKMPRALDRIDSLRAAGVDMTADMYPYVASGTGLSVLIPDWVSEGGRLYERLREPEVRRRAHAEMLAPQATTGDFAGGPRRADHVMPLGFQRPENRRFIGRRLTEIADAWGRDWADTAIELLLSENQRIATVFFSMCEENLRLQLERPWVTISTDAGGLDPTGQTTPVHPRAYGTYPRVLGHYVRDERTLSLEDAIRRMSGAVAARLRLKRRGLLLQGFFADIVVFDPGTVADRATFQDPHRLSVGIEQVLVNGVPVVENGAPTGALPGRTLLGPGAA